jgi:hypothetical protein
MPKYGLKIWLQLEIRINWAFCLVQISILHPSKEPQKAQKREFGGT